MAKADLTWEKPNAHVATPSSVDQFPSAGNPDRTSVDQVTSMAKVLGAAMTIEVIMNAAIDQQATDYAIDGICGEVNWGACERSHRHGH
jgi:hypothetical protein